MVCVSCAWEMMSKAPNPDNVKMYDRYESILGREYPCDCDSCMWIRKARLAADVDKIKVKQ